MIPPLFYRLMARFHFHPAGETGFLLEKKASFLVYFELQSQQRTTRTTWTIIPRISPERGGKMKGLQALPASPGRPNHAATGLIRRQTNHKAVEIDRRERDGRFQLLYLGLTQNENCHFTLCLLGCGRFHARKIGGPPINHNARDSAERTATSYVLTLRARVRHQTRQAPAALRVFAHSESVAPVVMMSSTRRRVCPQQLQKKDLPFCRSYARTLM